MTVDLATLPSPDTLPIPDDAAVNGLWPPLLAEIADHIGARTALELAARFGGQFIRIPKDPARGPFAEALGRDAAFELSRVFGGETLELPLGAAALRHARRQGVLSDVRAGRLSLADASRTLRTTRRTLTKWINETDEGAGSAAQPPRRMGDPRQIDLFD